MKTSLKTLESNFLIIFFVLSLLLFGSFIHFANAQQIKPQTNPKGNLKGDSQNNYQNNEDSESLAIEENILNEQTIDKADPSRFYSIATIQVLNKTTAKTSLVDLKIGQKISFVNLKVIAHKCWQAPLDQRPESKILLEIFEKKSEGEKEIEKRIFYGWMFTSSPSISGIEHPIYDLTAISCRNK